MAVVASNRGGAPEFVGDGQDGVLVDPFDTSALTLALGPALADQVERGRISRRRSGPGRRLLVAEDRRRLPLRL